MAVIRFEYEGKNYVLGFNRKTVKQMEREGFKLEDFANKPLTCISDLFAGAFKMNHRFEKREVIDKIHAALKDKEGLSDKLMQMYQDTVTTLIVDQDGEDDGNLINWSMSE